MNIRDAKKDIINTVKAYLAKDSLGQYLIPRLRQRPILLMGPPGIGKTQIMEQAARECRIGLVSYTITHHTRQSAVGLPFIREKEFEGTSYQVTEYTMSEIICSVYQYMEDTGRKEGILFIDEINCVSETLAPTMLQFLQYKTFGNQAVPEGWIIVTAGNPPEYNRSVHDFDYVTLDRVRRINIEADLDAFKSYAREACLHPFILSYLELRPQNFYRTETDVDGIQFVTARGWEDLSALITTYEGLSLPVDRSLIRQFLQHDDVALDVAAYYDLYKKYQKEYDISLILEGRAPVDIHQRLFSASFDEKLSCVELLVSGLGNYAGEAMIQEQITEEAFGFLKDYRKELRETFSGADSRPRPQALYPALLAARREAQKNLEKTGLVTAEEKTIEARLLALLSQWTPNQFSSEKAAFDQVKEHFTKQKEALEAAAARTSTALDRAFLFMEEAFGEGQEMVIFVTELTLDPRLSGFISNYGCDKYFSYNKRLLIGSRRAEILSELNRDKIYENVLEYEF